MRKKKPGIIEKSLDCFLAHGEIAEMTVKRPLSSIYLCRGAAVDNGTTVIRGFCDDTADGEDVPQDTDYKKE